MADEQGKASVVRVTVEHDGRTRTFEVKRPEGATTVELSQAITRAASIFKANVERYEITNAPTRPGRTSQRRPRA